MSRFTRQLSTVAIAFVAVGGAAVGSADQSSAAQPATSGSSVPDDSMADGEIDRVVDIGGRGLYLRCTGTGSPTVIMEAGDEDTSSSYGFAEADVAALTRTCVYDRANLGRSDAAPGPRGLSELVGDLEALLDAAAVDGPYVMVGTSGGGYISVAFAVAHPADIAGIVLVEVPSPFVDPPPEVVELTAWDHPANIEQRDYLQVEIDAWAARTEVGDIPVTVISNDYGPDAEPGERSNVADQEGWLVLSPRAEQLVVTTGHAVEEQDPQLVIDAILDVVVAASSEPTERTTGTNDTGTAAGVDTSVGATDVTIVGSWHRAQSCQEMLSEFDAAGLAESHLGWLQGNFFGGGPGPTEGDVCEGAQGPLEHDHFFTESGEFGSHDEHGEQVDGGDYEQVDDDTLVFPSHASEFGYDGDLTVDYEITADVVTFEVVMPDDCEDTCKDAYAWALSAFASGPWTRGEDTTTEPSPGSSEPATTDVGRIMFQRAPGGEVVEAEETDVYVVNADGSEERLLATGAQPGRWSPDGSEVSIFCCDEPAMVAHFVDVVTGEVRGLETPDPTLELHCAFGWSPDGERLVCEGYGLDDPSRNGIYSVRAADGGDLTRITSDPGGQDTPGEYSPDGTRLVFVRFEDDVPVGYFETNVDGTGARQLTPDGMVLDDSGFGGSWSPSGDDILFVARETEEHHKAIWIVNADEGSPEQLPITPACGGPLGAADEYGCYSPDWSPDGDRIVFTRSEPDGSNETLWIVNADGSNAVQVTDGTDDNPSWGPTP